MADFDPQVLHIAHGKGKEPVLRGIPADRLRVRYREKDYTGRRDGQLGLHLLSELLLLRAQLHRNFD